MVLTQNFPKSNWLLFWLKKKQPKAIISATKPGCYHLSPKCNNPNTFDKVANTSAGSEKEKDPCGGLSLSNPNPPRFSRMYIGDLGKQNIGNTVRIRGRLISVRPRGARVLFMVVRHQLSSIQCTLKSATPETSPTNHEFMNTMAIARRYSLLAEKYLLTYIRKEQKSNL